MPMERTSVACVGGSSTIHIIAMRAPAACRSLINDDPGYFFRRQRLAQASRQLEELAHVQEGPRLMRARATAFIADAEHRGNGCK